MPGFSNPTAGESISLALNLEKIRHSFSPSCRGCFSRIVKFCFKFSLSIFPKFRNDRNSSIVIVYNKKIAEKRSDEKEISFVSPRIYTIFSFFFFVEKSLLFYRTNFIRFSF